jgi:hypothetical protein
LLAALYVGEQYTERIVVLQWQRFQYVWYCRQGVFITTIKGNVFLCFHGNNINTNAMYFDSFVIVRFLILNFVNKSNEFPINTSSAWLLFFIKASFNLPHFLDYVVYQRYGRKYLKTWMPVHS